MAVRADKFLLLLLMASLCLNVYLGWQLKRPKVAPTETQTSLTVVPGTVVRQITAATLDGRQETIDYGNTQKPTVF